MGDTRDFNLSAYSSEFDNMQPHTSQENIAILNSSTNGLEKISDFEQSRIVNRDPESIQSDCDTSLLKASNCNKSETLAIASVDTETYDCCVVPAATIEIKEENPEEHKPKDAHQIVIGDYHKIFFTNLHAFLAQHSTFTLTATLIFMC